MVTPAAGEVVLVPFPLSDLWQSKVRPAVCLADVLTHSHWQSQWHQWHPALLQGQLLLALIVGSLLCLLQQLIVRVHDLSRRR